MAARERSPWIEVTQLVSGPTLVNMALVTHIDRLGDSTRLHFVSEQGSFIHVTESFEDIARWTDANTQATRAKAKKRQDALKEVMDAQSSRRDRHA